MKRIGVLFVCLLCLVPVSQAKDGILKTSPLAVQFGSQPDLRSLRISPDGTKLVFIQYHPDGIDIVSTWDVKTRKGGVIFAGEKGLYDITWCRWANKERILCAVRVTGTVMGNLIAVTRLEGVNADGKEMRLLRPKQFKKDPGKNIVNVIDLMPDDPRHVMVQVNAFGFGGLESGLGSLDIYNSRLGTLVKNTKNVFGWLSDGHGEPRLQFQVNANYRRWNIRDPGKIDWDVLHEVKADDFTDIFQPVGFGDSPKDLLVIDNHDGRRALYRMDLTAKGEKQLVYANDHVDVLSMDTMGKYNRGVAAVFRDGTLQRHYFDRDLQEIDNSLANALPGNSIDIIDEDWQRLNYIVFIHSDTKPGVYYLYDRKNKKLTPIGSISAKLNNRELSPVTKITYKAKDGQDIPANLILPAGGKKSGLPAVILPPAEENTEAIWGFDVLVQFLAANGYAVLQSYYHGSPGYGSKWQGMGPYGDWRKAVSDINDGAQYLIKQGIADPKRICAAGWGNGGYLALMSVIENASLYKCVASIAGVSDPGGLMRARGFGGGNQAQGMTGAGAGAAPTDEGSPLDRAGDIKIPVFLAHGEKDVNVPVSQSENLSTALKKQLKLVEFVEYENAEHSIRPERYRIDMLTRLVEFLNKYTK